MNYYYFIISILIIICIHEISHFLMAKLCKCKIKAISLGFGRAIFKKEIKGITYQISLLPIGGYVSLEGENGQSRSKYAFCNLPYYKKFAIAVIGCLVNIVMGELVFLFSTNDFTFIFGILSITTGIINLIPIAQCLDGGIIVYLPIYLHKYGRKLGWIKFNRACKVSFKILNITNIASIVYFIVYIILKYLK